jgi:enamine deaminase RidA (YjgF/YER057c/UK114 family)
MKKLLGAILLSLVGSSVVHAHPPAEIKRVKGDAQSPILASAIVPAGTTLVYLSGQVPAVTDGDTKAQAISVFTKIQKLLADQELTLGDVIKLTVYLVGDPKTGGKLDFKGFSEAYAQFFGTPTQPNIVTRTTVQVVALANPAYLVEIEATAAKSVAEKPKAAAAR